MKRRLRRFFKRIKFTEMCWLMSGSQKAGYCSYNGQIAHRFSYELFKGNIPKKMFVCHSCDVRNCVNPDHLWLGTNQDNMNDMKRKGRAPNNTGSKNPFSKLNEQQVKEIKKRLKNGEACREIAKDYNVKRVTIKSISGGFNWKHVNV